MLHSSDKNSMLANREVYLSHELLRVALGSSLLGLFGLHDLGGPLSKGDPHQFLLVGSFYRWFIGSFLLTRGSYGGLQVHLQPSLVQNFVLFFKMSLYYFFKMGSHFKKLIQNFEFKRVRGAPNDHPFAPLLRTNNYRQDLLNKSNYR